MDQKPLTKPNHWLFFFTVFIIIAFLPDVVIRLSTPEGLAFTGGLVNTDDLSVYFSAIRQGTEGAWLFTPQFSPEPIPAQFSYLPFLLIGKLMAWLGGSLDLWYKLLHLFSILCALAALKQLIQTVLPAQPDRQRTAWVLLLFGSGLGWLAAVVTGAFSTLSPDLSTPEWNLLTAAYSSPHFLLGIAAQAWFFAAVIKGLQQPQYLTFISGFLAAGLIVVSFPFTAVVAGLVLAVYFIAESLLSKIIPWKQIAFSLAQSIPLLIGLGYYGFILPNNRLWAETMLSNNQIMPPTLLGLLVGGGVLLPLALAASFRSGQQTISNRRLLICWLFVNLAALYLPINFSGRFLLGLFIPLALLASEGLESLISSKHIQKRPLFSGQRLRRMAIWLTIPSTLLLTVWALQTGLSSHGSPYFHPESITEAANFLAERTTVNDVVLAEYSIGNLLPRYCSARVFAGHLNLTIELDEKLDEMDLFWDAHTDNQWKDDFIEKWGISYILVQEPLPELAPGTIIYQENGVLIYQVQD